MQKEKVLLVAGVVLVIVILLIAFYFFAGGGKQPLNLLEKALLKQKAAKTEKTNLLLEQRDSYGISPAVFSELPEPPSDFNKIVSLYHQGKFRDELFFSEKYFLQPEFYPSFLQNGLSYWVNPLTTHYGAYGYGSFPIKKTVFAKAGEGIKNKFFFHSGYGVRSFQGVQLNPVFDAGGEFFDVTIKEPVFLLEPNFPKFNKGWAKDVELNVNVKEKTPKGTYKLKVFVSFPPEEYREKWADEINGKYFDAATFSTDKPLFELQIIVE